MSYSILAGGVPPADSLDKSVSDVVQQAVQLVRAMEFGSKWSPMYCEDQTASIIVLLLNTLLITEGMHPCTANLFFFQVK